MCISHLGRIWNNKLAALALLLSPPFEPISFFFFPISLSILLEYVVFFGPAV